MLEVELCKSLGDTEKKQKGRNYREQEPRHEGDMFSQQGDTCQNHPNDSKLRRGEEEIPKLVSGIPSEYGN